LLDGERYLFQTVGQSQPDRFSRGMQALQVGFEHEGFTLVEA